MVYEVPPSKASHKQNQFPFRVPGKKKTYWLPKLQYVRPGLAKPLAELAGSIEGKPTPDQAMQLFDLQMRIFEHYVPGFADLFEGQDQIAALMEAWQVGSSVSLGESSASADS